MCYVLVKRSPFTSAEIAVAREFLSRDGFHAIYLPDGSARLEDLPERWRKRASLVAALLTQKDRQSLYRNADVDIVPTTDDQPFYFVERAGPNRAAGQGLKLLLLLAAFLAVLAVALLFAPLAPTLRRMPALTPPACDSSPTVACSGPRSSSSRWSCSRRSRSSWEAPRRRAADRGSRRHRRRLLHRTARVRRRRSVAPFHRGAKRRSPGGEPRGARRVSVQTVTARARSAVLTTRYARSMELALETDGTLAVLRVIGPVSMADTGALSEYLRVARENGAVRCLLDFAECTDLPTTIVPLLTREAAKLAETGGTLALASVDVQNPFLAQAVEAGKFLHYRTREEALAIERSRAMRIVDDPRTQP
jgi:hypothetical protein